MSKTIQRLKLRGEGDSPPHGGLSGDLYVIVKIQDHPLFLRKENDLILELPVFFLDIITGATVEIPTLDGKASLKIPPGTHANQTFRLKGKGFKNLNNHMTGDMLVKIIIDLPEKLNNGEVNELKKFKSQTLKSLVKTTLQNLMHY